MVKYSSGDPLDHYYYNFIFRACLRIPGSISVSSSSTMAGGKKSILFPYIFAVFLARLDCLPPRRGHHLLSRKSGMSVTCIPEPALLCSVAFVPSHPQFCSLREGRWVQLQLIQNLADSCSIMVAEVSLTSPQSPAQGPPASPRILEA